MCKRGRKLYFNIGLLGKAIYCLQFGRKLLSDVSLARIVATGQRNGKQHFVGENTCGTHAAHSL